MSPDATGGEIYTSAPDNPEQEGKKSKNRKHRSKKSKGQTNEGDEEFVLENKPRRKRQPKPEPVYIIPDVERKDTTFKGRLGYACLNTVLRNKRPASDSTFCSRTCRLDSLNKNGLDWVKDIGRQNVRDLITMIQWNEDNHIRFLRLSSEMFPFASHENHGYSLDYCTDLLEEAGDLANKYGHRLTTHPGQFTQLGSPKPKVVDAAVRELDYHCQMLDLMGIGIDGVMIVHGGGTYGDKASAIERLKRVIAEVLPPRVRARLVLENDEMCYNAEELLSICEELDVPFVLDYHHDMLNPSSIPPSEIIKRAGVIWKHRGIRPKQHLSEPRPGAVTLMERRAHADRCETLPADLPDDMDLMIEAKDKEQAVFHLYRIYDLAPVIHANLRPPNPNPSKETNGRKSNKRARATKLRAGDPGSNDEMLLDPQDEEDEAVIDASVVKDVRGQNVTEPLLSANHQQGAMEEVISRTSQGGIAQKAKRQRKRKKATATTPRGEVEEPSDRQDTGSPGKKPRSTRHHSVGRDRRHGGKTSTSADVDMQPLV
ncbi:UV-endonuclease UvdE [Macrolepiota fuliginosa MF-IS2]|uniref:UV-endonuclease UvdE n=1 Tax=Macrolepiota fuliginosa MF-IS2 TaxID=1400762 RepID=A0A9P5XLS8_9AGAR|nr:UV-endonuclease UvdE [Macrolepiota fuliginosa MF-IS2]